MRSYQLNAQVDIKPADLDDAAAQSALDALDQTFDDIMSKEMIMQIDTDMQSAASGIHGDDGITHQHHIVDTIAGINDSDRQLSSSLLRSEEVFHFVKNFTWTLDTDPDNDMHDDDNIP